VHDSQIGISTPNPKIKFKKVAYFQAPKTTSQRATENHALTIYPPQKTIRKIPLPAKPPPKTPQNHKSPRRKKITKTLT